MTYFLAPYVNSYKRFQAGSFAPTNLVWSRDNRTSGFRVLGHGPATRIECRVGGADVNPYLAFAAFLAAGLHGIEQKLPLQPAFQGDAYKSGEVPSVPPHAARCASTGSTARRCCARRLGDEVIDHYVHAGRWEQARVRQGGHRLGARALFRARRSDAGALDRLDAAVDPGAAGAWDSSLAGIARWQETPTTRASARYGCFRRRWCWRSA